MKNNNSNALRWLLVALFSVLGLGMLTGSAFAQDPTPAPAAQASQIGDNNVVVDQKTTVQGGDSVAGSQVVGVVGGGDHTIQNQNSSTGATATTEPVTVNNTATVNVGPSATSTAPSNGPILIAGATSVSNDSTVNVGPQATGNGNGAMASQIGDNNVVVNQVVDVRGGDCVAGSQVVGVVGGSATIQNQNSSTGASCGPATPPNGEDPNGDPVAVLEVTKTCFEFGTEGEWQCDITVTNTSDVDAEDPVLEGGWFNQSPTGFTAPAGWDCFSTGDGTAACAPDDSSTVIEAGDTLTFSYTFNPGPGTFGDTVCASGSNAAEDCDFFQGSNPVFLGLAEEEVLE